MGAEDKAKIAGFSGPNKKSYGEASLKGNRVIVVADRTSTRVPGTPIWQASRHI